MNPLHGPVASRAGHRCEYCRAPEAVFNFPFEVEHIVPIARGGTQQESNLALACRSCNLRKATHFSGIDPQSERMTRLFHPREEKWEDHFAVDESDEVLGLTPAGRATIVRLDMNSSTQRAARRQWRRLSVFP